MKISKDYSTSQRKAIGQEIIDLVIDRTKKGQGVITEGGQTKLKTFPVYSKSYIDSVDFKAAGKSASKVNLTLSSEMLEELETVDYKTAGEIETGYESASEEVKNRVEGNILGSYGGKPSKKKARNFLGITDKELKSILKNYPLNDKTKLLTRMAAFKLVSREAEKITGSISDAIEKELIDVN